MAAHDDVHAGYLPLLDCAVLIVAARLGFAEAHGIDLKLHREVSWATIRDRMGVGHFDCAHMLAPMPIAASLGYAPLPIPMIAPMVLGLGGNAVTIGPAIAEFFEEAGPGDPGPAATGIALRSALQKLHETTGRKGRFAVVHSHSSHNYDLRYWLAASGIAPDRDVEITVVPPPLMPDALAGGHIDGFTVGEPWNTIAVRRGVGRIVTTKAEIHRRSPEKVLGVAAAFAKERPDTLRRLVTCLVDAAEWCDCPSNRPALAALLAEPRHIGVAAFDLMPGLSGEIEIAPGTFRTIADFMVFWNGSANRPHRAYGEWLFEQMVRWGDADASDEARSTIAGVFDPAIFDDAVKQADDRLKSAGEPPFPVSLFDDGMGLEPN